jgi:hypothetical protein
MPREEMAKLTERLALAALEDGSRISHVISGELVNTRYFAAQFNPQKPTWTTFVKFDGPSVFGERKGSQTANRASSHNDKFSRSSSVRRRHDRGRESCLLLVANQALLTVSALLGLVPGCWWRFSEPFYLRPRIYLRKDGTPPTMSRGTRTGCLVIRPTGVCPPRRERPTPTI